MTATPGQAARFRLRPITVEAVQWTGDNLDEVYELTGCANFDVLSEQDRANCDDPDATAAVFARLHNSTWKLVCTGQWIVKGAKGEFFPLPDELFREAYEDAAQEPKPAPELAAAMAESRGYREAPHRAQEALDEGGTIGRRLSVARSIVKAALEGKS